MQKGGRGVSAGQRTQRGRFIYIKDKYKTLSAPEKERWKDANPEYHSYLFGYNFFMLEGLMGGGTLEYPQMIKSIQVLKASVPKTGGHSYAINTVDPAKTVVMIQGNSYISDKIQRGSGSIADGGTNNHALSPSVDPNISEVRVSGEGGRMDLSEGTGAGFWCAPYAYSLSASQLTVKMIDVATPVTAGYSWEVTEHKAQTVYPVLVSVGANAVVMDWALVPSVAAYVSITVVEYL